MVIEFQKLLKEVAAEEQELKSIIEGGEFGIRIHQSNLNFSTDSNQICAHPLYVG